MEQEWIFLENTFDNTTRDNNSKMLTISEFHYNRLAAEAPTNTRINECHLRYKTVHDIFATRYMERQQAGGTQKADTATIDELLEQDTQMLDDWDPKIQIVYPKTSTAYLNFFPQGRRPFTHGSKETRISAFEALASKVNADPALVAIHTATDVYAGQLGAEREDQQKSMSKTETAGDALEEARIDCAEVMYQDLGDLMSLFYKDRQRIGDFFDLVNIRQHTQLVFRRQVKAGTIELIVKRKLGATKTIKLKNTGLVSLLFYMADSATTPPNPEFGITLEAGQTQTVTAGSLGAPDLRYLLVHNAAVADGKCEVDLA